MKMDETDLAILDVLSKDSRLSMREIAKQVNLSAPSVAERVRKLESQGVIDKYTIRINRKKLGLTLDCLIEVTIKNGDYDKFRRFVEKEPRVVFCCRVAGRACFFVKLSVTGLQEIEAFIDTIAPYAVACTHIIFSEVSLSEDIKQQFANAGDRPE